jgi:MarR family 2-MHQ and catechol resistance regulon transcriptional repressor
LEQISKNLKTVAVILRASQSIQELIKKDAAIYGLNPTEFAVLELLYNNGDQPIQVIGKKVLISSGSITYVVDKLEQKKFVIRKACPEDRRVTYGAITAHGKAFMNQIFPHYETKIDEIFEQLAHEDIDKVIELLKRVGNKVVKL